MFVRGAVSASLAVVVTLGLFTLMRTLVDMSEVGLDEYGKRKVIEFVRLKRDTTTQVRKRELPQREKAKAPPKTPKMERSKTSGPGSNVVAVSAPTADASLDVKGKLQLGGAPADTEAVPLVRVQPIYPQHARSRKIEGWVTVKFDIDLTGKVVNVSVIGAEPTGVFESAAQQTIKRWKYKPKIVDGKARVQRGIKVKLRFKLDD